MFVRGVSARASPLQWRIDNKSAFFTASVALIPLLAGTAAATAAELEEVFVTATRTPVPGEGVIGNRAVLDREMLETVSPVHIQEVLARVPGVDMHRNNGQEYLPAIRSPVLTGAGACGSFLMAEDGIPLRPAGFCNVNELFEAHTEQARRIEVIRGPANALYGSNALHGVINVIAPAAFEEGSRLGLEGGPWDYGRLSFSHGGDDLALAFTGSTADSFRDAAGVDQQKLSLRHRFRGKGYRVTTGLTATNLNQETASYVVGHEAYKDRDAVEENPDPEAFRDARALRVWSRIEDDADRPAWVVTPYARYSDMDFFQHFLPGTPLEQNGQRSAGVQSAFYRYGDNTRLIAGLDLEITRGWLEQAQEGPTEGSPFLEETIPAGQHYDYVVNAIQAAPYVQGRWEFLPRWHLTAGLRYEYMRYDYDNRMLAGRTREDGTECGFGGCHYSRPADRTDDFHNASATLGLGHTLREDHRAFLNLARGFRAPQAVELYRLQREQQVADLDSPQLDSAELGLRGETNKLAYELVAYAMRKDNVIFRDSDFFNVSDGETSHHGLEVALAWEFNEHFDLNLSASVARHRYEHSQILNGVDIEGNDVDSAPHRFGSLRLGWRPVADARLELEWLHRGDYYTDPENLHSYDGHDVFHLRSRWQVTPGVSLSARLVNVLDTEYAERADYTGFVGDRYFPGDPRSLYLGVDLSW